MVVSNILYVHPILGKIPIVTDKFSKRFGSTINQWIFLLCAKVYQNDRKCMTPGRKYMKYMEDPGIFGTSDLVEPGVFVEACAGCVMKLCHTHRSECLIESFYDPSDYITLPKTNIAPENGPPKRKLVFQPSIFRCYVSFRGCTFL